MPIGVVKFAEFELDGGRYELRRGARVLKLEKIPMELLTILVEGNGQLVTRDEIVEKVWGKDVFLDTEHGINTAIRKIRQTLGDDPENPRFVQTVTGKGYRFIAPTTAIPAGGNGSAVARDPALAEAPPEAKPLSELGSGHRGTAVVAPATEPRAGLGRRLRLTGIAWIASVGIVAVVIGLNVRGVRDRLFSRSPRPRIHSLAVLPLENLSADSSQEYFADGMTDELITMLAKNPELRVVSRTSVMQYKKVHRPLVDVARELGVDGILEGSVERSGKRVHINTQLIYAPEDRHLWAESYDRDLNDLASLQSELAKTIAREVGLTTSPASQAARSINTEAHDAYLLGRYYWFSLEYEKAKESFEKAIRLQPDYAAAWSGLADYYTALAAEGEISQHEAISQAEPAARKALALDDASAEAHQSMTAVYYFLRWDWEAAEKESARTIELNPNLAEAHHLRSYLLGTMGRMDDALQEERKSMELDPFARPWALVYALLRARKYDDALQEARARTAAVRNDEVLNDMLASVYLQKGMTTDAVRQWQRSLNVQQAEELDRTFVRGGIRAVYEMQLSRLSKAAAKRYVSPLEFASAYARLGEKESTLRYLESSYRERVAWLVHIESEPEFDFVHGDPRYQAIVKGMRLPLR